MTDYPMLDDKLATLRHAIEGGVKADSMQALKLMELVDAIGEQFKRELDDATPTPLADAAAIAEREARHVNDDTAPDAECAAALSKHEAWSGQGVDPYWAWGFRKGWKEARAALATTKATDAIAPTEGMPDSFPDRLLHESDESLAWRVDEWHKRNPAPSPEAPAVDALTTGAMAEPVYLLRYKRTVIPPAKWEIVEKAEYEGAVDSYEKRILYAHPASEPKAPYLPCPICNGIEGCDHTVPERRAAREPKALTAEQREAIGHLVARGSTFPDHNGPNGSVSRVDYRHLQTAAKVLSALLADRGSEGGKS